MRNWRTWRFIAAAPRYRISIILFGEKSRLHIAQTFTGSSPGKRPPSIRRVSFGLNAVDLWRPFLKSSARVLAGFDKQRADLALLARPQTNRSMHLEEIKDVR
jgi:hypothetical protein